jgi:hypothetical protein
MADRRLVYADVLADVSSDGRRQQTSKVALKSRGSVTLRVAGAGRPL